MPITVRGLTPILARSGGGGKRFALLGLAGPCLRFRVWMRSTTPEWSRIQAAAGQPGFASACPRVTGPTVVYGGATAPDDPGTRLDIADCLHGRSPDALTSGTHSPSLRLWAGGKTRTLLKRKPSKAPSLLDIWALANNSESPQGGGLFLSAQASSPEERTPWAFDRRPSPPWGISSI